MTRLIRHGNLRCTVLLSKGSAAHPSRIVNPAGHDLRFGAPGSELMLPSDRQRDHGQWILGGAPT
eukprot:7531630-Pyramimonas_sp.AAC.1